MATDGKLIRTPVSSETSEQRDSLIRKSVVILAETYQFDLPEAKQGRPSLVDTWVVALEDLPIAKLEAGFKKLLQTWRPDYGRKFPAPGDLRALVDVPAPVVADHTAEVAWIMMLNAIMEYFHPDIGWRGPKLDEKSAHAAGLALGRDFARIIWNATNEQRVWIKKDFLATYNRCTALEDWTPMPELVEFLNGFSLPQAKQPEAIGMGEEEIKLPARAEPAPALSREEWERRKVEQKERFALYAKERGLKLE